MSEEHLHFVPMAKVEALEAWLVANTDSPLAALNLLLATMACLKESDERGRELSMEAFANEVRGALLSTTEIRTH